MGIKFHEMKFIEGEPTVEELMGVEPDDYDTYVVPDANQELDDDFDDRDYDQPFYANGHQIYP